MPESDEELVRHEEDAAAEEAGHIGGRAPEDADPERRPVEEAGGGQAEGFEQAEEELIDHASYTSGEGTPRPEQMGDEAELDPATYGEADKPEPDDH